MWVCEGVGLFATKSHFDHVRCVECIHVCVCRVFYCICFVVCVHVIRAQSLCLPVMMPSCLVVTCDDAFMSCGGYL